MTIFDDLKLQYKSGGITQQLIFWNIGLFVIPMIVFSILSLFTVDVSFLRWDSVNPNDWFSLSSNITALLWKPWSLITYAFLHAGFLHLLFNMLMLFFAGRVFTTFFTQKQLFGVYILSSVFAGLIFIASYNLLPMLSGYAAISKMVGASAAIMAIIVATAVYSPHYQIRLLLFGTVKLWHIAVVFIILDLIQVSVENPGGHLAHLAGAFFGYVYIKILQKGTDLSLGITYITNFFANLFVTKKQAPFKKVHRNTEEYKRPAGRQNKDILQQQIDAILDKISKSGYDSLTKEEKEFLFKAGK